MRQSRFQKGVEKIIDFRDPIFLSILADFGCPGGVKKFTSLAPLSALFRSWGLFFLLGRHFGSFWWILVLSEPFSNDFWRSSGH